MVEETSHGTHAGFSPSLWKQRRQFILETLDRFQVESVLDYGCGEASVLSVLACPDTRFKRLAGIDIDRDVLTEAVEACQPLPSDYQFPRASPLSIDLYQGSIGLADARLSDYEAIVCSEVIEHVYPQVLEGFLDLTLGLYQPRLMIVTTPNAEYNVYFPNLGYGTDHASFRHDDHKFEWTRSQFEAWCRVGAEKYGYQLEFHGIGLLNRKEQQYGHCTQACLFIQTTPRARVRLENKPHQLIQHIDFPYDSGVLSREEVMSELVHYVQALCDGELYYRENTQPSQPMTHSFELEPISDWTQLNLDHYYIPSPVPVKPPTSSSIILHLESLWEIDRVQRICQTEATLRAYLDCCQQGQAWTFHDDQIHLEIK